MTRYTRGLRLLPAVALTLALFFPRDAAAAFDNVVEPVAPPSGVPVHVAGHAT